MRDQRAEALAQILVRYSTRVQGGRRLRDPVETAAEPLCWRSTRRCCGPAGYPIVQLTHGGPGAAFFKLASDEQLDWVSPTAQWAAENADVRIAIMADTNTRALSQRRPAQARRAARRPRKPLMETMMRRAAAGELPLGADAVPDGGLRRRGGHVAAPSTRTSSTAPACADDADPVDGLAAPVGRGASAWPSGSPGKEEVHIQAPGTDLTLNVAGRTLIPCDGRAQHARRRVLHRPGRGLGERRGGLQLPGRLRRPRGGGRAASASRTARSWTRRPSAARSS